MRRQRNKLLLYSTLYPSTGEEEQVPQASTVLYFTYKYCGRRAGPTCYCCTLLYTSVLVRKSRSLKLLLYSTLHPGIVEGEQVQHVTAVLYITPQYWWGRAGPSSFCCTLLYTHLNPKVLALIFPIHEICKYASDQLKQIQVLIKQKYSTHIPDQ